MGEAGYYLVEANLAMARAPLDDPLMADFVARLDEIDALAAGWPGFIAQPELADGGTVYAEPALLNVSTWESVESLRAFTYASRHKELLDRRAEWFVQSDRPAYVLYWAAAGQAPTEAAIQARFDHLARHGLTPYAFDFEQPYSVAEMLAYQGRGGMTADRLHWSSWLSPSTRSSCDSWQASQSHGRNVVHYFPMLTSEVASYIMPANSLNNDNAWFW